MAKTAAERMRAHRARNVTKRDDRNGEALRRDVEELRALVNALHRRLRVLEDGGEPMRMVPVTSTVSLAGLRNRIANAMNGRLRSCCRTFDGQPHEDTCQEVGV